MAGLTERRSAGQDSFWTWRTLMYRFLDQLTPDDVQAIAAMVMVEMAEAGFAAVAEFHYLHHAPAVAHAMPISPKCRPVLRRRQTETGLGLTHLPVLYERGGCDDRAADRGAAAVRQHAGPIRRPVAGGTSRTSNTCPPIPSLAWRRTPCARPARQV